MLELLKKCQTKNRNKKYVLKPHKLFFDRVITLLFYFWGHHLFFCLYKLAKAQNYQLLGQKSKT